MIHPYLHSIVHPTVDSIQSSMAKSSPVGSRYGSIPPIRFLCLVSMATLVVSGMLLKRRISFPFIDSPLLMPIGITSNNQMFHSCIDIKFLMPMNEIMILLYEYGTCC